MKIILLSFALILFISCQEQAPPVEPNIEDVQKVMSDYRAAWREGDSSMILKHISPDVRMFQPGKTDKPISGKEALSQFWFPESDMSYPILKYEVSNEDIGMGGKYAYYQGLSTLEWCIEENGVQRDTTLSISEFTTLLRHEDEAWKIYRIMFNSKDNSYSW